MDTNTQPSFIPKKTFAEQSNLKPRRSVSLFSMIGTVIFLTILALSGAAFGAEYYFKKQLEEKKQTLQTQLDAFEPSLVAELSRLESRLISANQLLNSHISVSEVFKMLGRATLKPVQYGGFSYASSGEQGATVSLDGIADSFATVALQQMELYKPEHQKYFKSPSFSNLNLDSEGGIVFKLSSQISPQYLQYRVVSKQQVPTSTASSTSVQATSTRPSNQ